MELASLRDAKIGDLYGVAGAYNTLTDALTTHTADWTSGTVQAVQGSGWTGQAAETAQASLAATDDKLQAAGLELGTIYGQLCNGADALQLAQSKLLQALADAEAQGFSVNDCGAVSWPPPAPGQRHDDPADWQARQQSAADAISTRISGALAEATTADQALAATLKSFTDRATNGSGLDLQTANADRYQSDFGLATPAYLQGVPAGSAGPAEWNSWWKGLTPAEQQWFIANHPDLLGNQDGIPAAVRDQVNRAWLTNQLAPIDQKVAHGTPLTATEQDALKKLGPIRDRLNDDANYTTDQPRDYLLGIGTEGQGRAIISFGDPDTATDISAYVPGMTSDPSSLKPGRNITDGSNEAENTLWAWRSAQAKESPGGRAAAIVWLGYDAPPGNLAVGEVASADRADSGAPAFAKFVTGLRATNGTAHVTSIGHSYGSLLVGTATKLSTQPGSTYRPPDDVVLIGSPGAGVNSAADLRLPGHVWVGAADNDMVTHTPSRADVLAGAIGGPVGLYIAHKFDPRAGWYGTDPASADFGAQRFAVDDSSCPNPIDAHLKYQTPGNGGPSLNNIGAIVAGQYGQVQREDRR
ncbi:alpha/beta hydrolase [Kitasatospora sp. LaBMicrA B282]|uniref:alpha/beta hydrolase n=1 Tax=Kitasatospora sp. LaBMicrA B282 TaxID=3420949 RepID=UPI003D0BD06F